ncbi:hypothetical protein J7M23_07770 [Candidatus Sumerlaeota bacterium]|nr:hypothetical protein [Candidatus Sumerlaeota bacterium]
MALPSKELSPDVVFVLRKARWGIKKKSAESLQPVLDTVVDNGWVTLKRTLWGKEQFRLTSKGKRLLTSLKHSPNPVLNGIAQGFCDHLSYRMFKSMQFTGALQSYIEAQRNLHRLILMHFFWNR